MTGTSGGAPRRDGNCAGEGRGAFRAARGAGFALLAAFILLSPAPGQLFGAHSPFLREWVMFSGVGVGIPRGDFIVARDGREVARRTPLEALGLAAYPQIRHYAFEERVVEDADLARFARALCEEAGEGGRVGFVGSVGTRQGWRPIEVEDVCRAAPPGRTASAGSPGSGARP